jgi:hypothetical protein
MVDEPAVYEAERPPGPDGYSHYGEDRAMNFAPRHVATLVLTATPTNPTPFIVLSADDVEVGRYETCLKAQAAIKAAGEPGRRWRVVFSS